MREQPRTGPLPASSIPMMQGSDAHSGTIPASDPISAASLQRLSL